MAIDQCFNIGSCYNLAEPFTVLAVCFVKAKTIFNDRKHLSVAIDPGQFLSEFGVTSKLAAQQDPESGFPRNECSGGADLDALPAIQTAKIIDNRTLALTVETDCTFFAGLNACFAMRAGFTG
jgi:hypothetical protein